MLHIVYAHDSAVFTRDSVSCYLVRHIKKKKKEFLECTLNHTFAFILLIVPC